MKILLRIILFLLALALLCGLVGILSQLVPIPWLSAFAGRMVAQYPWLTTAFSIVLLFCIAAGVLALILIVSVPSKRRLFVMGRSAGNVEITRQSIESAAGASLDTIHEVKRYHVQARGDMRPGRLKLDVQVQPRSGQANLNELGNTVQQKLAQDLAACLAMEPKHIKIRIQPIHQTADERRQHAKVPRVV